MLPEFIAVHQLMSAECKLFTTMCVWNMQKTSMGTGQMLTNAKQWKSEDTNSLNKHYTVDSVSGSLN